MAKSLRSKWRRKCKAVKRERYGVKEFTRLKKTLGIDESSNADVEMSELSKIATVTNAKTMKEDAKAKENEADDIIEKMDDGGRVYNKKTLRDQYGNYPVWLNRRKILKHKKGRAKTKKASATKHGKRLTRREKKKSGEKK